MNFIMRIIVTSIVAFGLSYLLSDGVHIDKFTTAIILAVVLALLIADKILKGFGVDGFWWALLFSLLLSIVTSLLYKERRDEKDA
jgi:putative membrane protein